VRFESGLLYSERHRSRLRNGAGSTRNSNDVRACRGPGIPSSSTASSSASAFATVAASAATECASDNAKEQYE
jgi:hypothetical protein